MHCTIILPNMNVLFYLQIGLDCYWGHYATVWSHRRFESDVPTLYTRGGGINKYEKTKCKDGERKGWSDNGIRRINALFEVVK